MTIQINRPEIEGLIQQRLHSGAFESVEDVLIDALEVQREREAWLQENKETINDKINHGLAQLDRGEGLPGEGLRERLEDDKAAWLKGPLRVVKLLKPLLKARLSR
jgi:antitoxin ParD1/3/4